MTTKTPAAGSSGAAVPLHVIRRTRGWTSLHVRELFAYRELLGVLMWRDISVRYKQTAIGFAWALLQPFLAMLVFSTVFGRLAGLPSDGKPYPVFVYAGLLPWQFFSKALTEASLSLVGNERVITKVYFPRVLVPTAVVLAGLVDLALAFLVLCGMMVYYGIAPSWGVLALPGFVALAVVTALGVSFWLSALDVRYRDVRYTLPLLTQIWMFSTPVVYPLTLVPEAWRPFASLNPMTAVTEGFRWAMLAGSPPALSGLVLSGLVAFGLLGGGVYFFRIVERTLADRI